MYNSESGSGFQLDLLNATTDNGKGWHGANVKRKLKKINLLKNASDPILINKKIAGTLLGSSVLAHHFNTLTEISHTSAAITSK